MKIKRQRTEDELRAYVAEHRHDPGGVRCPTCDQIAAARDRQIHSSLARASIVMYREHRHEWFHLPTLTAEQKWTFRDATTLQYFGLLEDGNDRREDGGKAGWHRTTPLMGLYVRGAVALHQYVQVYNGEVLSTHGPRRTIKQALGTKFDYTELMRGSDPQM